MNLQHQYQENLSLSGMDSALLSSYVRGLAGVNTHSVGHAYRIVARHSLVRQYVSQHITQLVTVVDPDTIVIIKPSDTGSISIEQVRHLYATTANKSYTGNRRIVRIVDAHTMTPPAQNALLKLLEEPPANTTFLLESPQIHALLPTIGSRSGLIVVTPASKEAFTQHLVRTGMPETEAHKRFYATGGDIVSELVSRDQGGTDRSMDEALGAAKEFFVGTAAETALVVQKWSKDRALTLQYIDALITIMKAALHSSTDSTKRAQWARWADATLTARSDIEAGAGHKLRLTRLTLDIRSTTR